MNNFSMQSKLVATVVLAAGAATGLAVGTHPGSANVRPSEGSSHAHHEHHADALSYAFGHLGDRYESGAGVWVERTLADLLPNRKFAIEGAQPRTLSPGTVVGTVTSAIGGAGYAVEGADADNGTVVAFDSEDALWRVAELTVSVTEGFGLPASETEVRIALPFDGREDRDAFLQGFANQRVIVALAPKGAVRHDPTLYSIAHGGGLLGLVSDEGQISFPIMGDTEATFLNGLTNVSELRRQMNAAPKVLRVVLRGGVVPHVEE